MSAVSPRDTTPPQKKRKRQKKGTLTNETVIFQTAFDKRPKEGASTRARKWCMAIYTKNGKSRKTVGSFEKTETLESRFKAKFPDDTPRIGKEDAESWVKTRFVSSSYEFLFLFIPDSSLRMPTSSMKLRIHLHKIMPQRPIATFMYKYKTARQGCSLVRKVTQNSRFLKPKSKRRRKKEKREQPELKNWSLLMKPSCWSRLFSRYCPLVNSKTQFFRICLCFRSFQRS